MGIIRDTQRAHATQAHAQQRSQAAMVRQREQIRRNADLAIAAAQQAAEAADQRERQRLYADARAADAAAANADLHSRLAELDRLLLSTLDVDDHIDLDRFKKPVAAPPFDPGPLGRPLPAPDWQIFAPEGPSGINKILGGDRLHQQQLAAARTAFDEACRRHAEAEARRLRQLAARQEAYEQSRRRHEQRIAAYNAEVDRFAAALADADPATVVEYFSMVLGNSVYPDDFPQRFRLAFLPRQRHLLVEYHLPPVDVIPVVKEYRYDAVRDDIIAVGRTAAEIRQRYIDIIAQVSLRTIHEIVEADRGRLVQLVSFNGIVDTVDRRTGRSVRPCLVSLHTDRETFAAIKLRRVVPVACLSHLQAAVSTRPDELAAVPAVVDIDRAETSYRDEVDVLADVDHRPNLADLSDAAYRSLVADLLTVMGLRMGEADAAGRWLAVDPRPLFGGPVVVHATRADRVGADAVRALADAVTTAAATKGVLVTTGGYAADAHQAVSGPLELIDGSGLLHLLAEHCRIKARIDNHTVG